MTKVFKVLIVKENFPVHIYKRILSELSSGCCSEVEAFFRLKGFHPFLDIYLHTVGADPGRPLFFSCLLIFLVEFPLSYFAFSITFFAVLSRTDGRPLLGLS